MTRVEICGVGFSGSSAPESGLIYQELKDWDGRPDARGGGESIPGANGVFPRTVEARESRAISVKAAIVTDSTDEYFETKYRVENMPMFGEMRVDQGDGVWTRDVEIDSISIPDAHTRTWTPFTIDIIAPDPVRYRDWVTAGPAGLPTHDGGLILPEEFPWDFGSSTRPVATVVNDGALTVLPRVTVVGSADSIVVHGGPRRMSFGAFAGELVLDSLDRRAYLNGVDVTRDLIRRDWPVVPAGASQDFYFEAVNPSPDLALTVDYRIGAW